MITIARRIARTACLVFVVACLYVGLTAFEVWRVGRTSGFVKASAIMVMGAAQYDGTPSPLLAARLDHAFELWEAGAAKLIIVTGGNQPGDRFTEASSSRRYLVERGVPEGAILEESTSHSTWEAMANVRQLVDESKDFSSVTDVVIVTDPFHSLRSRLVAQELGFDASTSSTDTSPVAGSRAASKHVKEALGIAIGRLIGFERLWKVTG